MIKIQLAVHTLLKQKNAPCVGAFLFKESDLSMGLMGNLLVGIKGLVILNNNLNC